MNTKNMTQIAFSVSVCVALLMLPIAGAAAARSSGETFTALAYLPTGGATATVDIHIDGYSSDQDVLKLHGILMDGGPNALLKALEKMKPLGKISRTGTVGFYDLKMIRSIQTPTGRHIIAVTDRPIGFLEAYFHPRSIDYRFGVLELDLKSGEKEEGEGSLVYAAKINLHDDGTIEIENLGITPVRLLGVKRVS